MAENKFEKVYAVVRQVPPGKVVTYGQVAFWLGWPHGARTVGWAMRGCPADVPWQRVVNSKGRLSVSDTDTQRTILETEGVHFSIGGYINLKEFRWDGPPELPDDF